VSGYVVEAEFYDAAMSGADAVTERPGFLARLQRIAGNGVRTVIVESPDRFAYDLVVQLAGHDMLKGLGIDLIPASAPDFFTEDTPTAVRQVLGTIAQFEKGFDRGQAEGGFERRCYVNLHGHWFNAQSGAGQALPTKGLVGEAGRPRKPSPSSCGWRTFAQIWDVH
jgi:hypothetical protein